MVVAVAAPLMAQIGGATLTGRVVDQARAVVPGATVTPSPEKPGSRARPDTEGRAPLRLPGLFRCLSELRGVAGFAR